MLVLISVFLSGCLYPDKNLSKNQVPNDIQLQSVQTAVEQYQEQNTYQLPIQNRDQDTPVFQKYPIDFNRLKQQNLLSEAPGNSFEQGGVYQYVIVDPENELQVKVMDLRVTQELREINFRLNTYRSEHLYVPFGEKINDQVYTLNYEELGYENPLQVKSPYTQNQLPIVVDLEGEIYVDYRSDLNQFLQQYEHDYETGDDIRYLLSDHSPFVPAHTLPYTVVDGEPVFMNEMNQEDAS